MNSIAVTRLTIYKHLRVAAQFATIALFSTGLQAEDKKLNPDLELAAGPPEQCVSLAHIDRTEVVDDQNILFYMSGDRIYRNHLPHRCPGLGFHESFMYRTSLSQLCNLDIITVLDNIGFGFSPGVSCGLGHFYPITEEDARALQEKSS